MKGRFQKKERIEAMLEKRASGALEVEVANFYITGSGFHIRISKRQQLDAWFGLY